MKALQTLKYVGSYTFNGNTMPEYVLENAAGRIIADVDQRTPDGNIHRVRWVGGIRHDMVEFFDGGVVGLMETIGDLLAA